MWVFDDYQDNEQKVYSACTGIVTEQGMRGWCRQQIADSLGVLEFGQEAGVGGAMIIQMQWLAEG